MTSASVIMQDPLPKEAIPEGGCFVTSPAAIDCPLGDGLAIFDTRTNSYFSLNQTGALIWNSARTPTSFDALLTALTDRFDCDAQGGAADLRTLLASLIDARLMEHVAAAEG